MISTGHWTRLDLACVLGLERMGESIAEIALTMGRTEQDVRHAFDLALSLIWMPPELPHVVTDKAGAAPAPVRSVQLPKYQPRKFRVSKEAIRFLPKPERDVTAILFGDPDPDRAANRKQAENTGDRR